jgi:hypothetical protein
MLVQIDINRFNIYDGVASIGKIKESEMDKF